MEEFKFGCELILFGYDVLSCKRRLSFRCMCLSKTVWTTPVVVDLPCIPQALSSDNKELISAFRVFNMMEMGETTSSLSCHLLNCREININLFISLDVWCAGCGDRNWILSHDMKVSKRRESCCDEECVFVVDSRDIKRTLSTMATVRLLCSSLTPKCDAFDKQASYESKQPDRNVSWAEFILCRLSSS